MNLSVLVGLKNNLDYTKFFYKHFRNVYPEVELCFVSYGSTDGTTLWLDEILKKDKNVQVFVSNQNKTFSDTYNTAASIATKDFILFMHNDIVVVPNFLENVMKYLKSGRAVGYTTIEPPIFAGHSRPGKLIADFGDDLESFNLEGLSEYCIEKREEFENATQDGVFFFMGVPKKLFLEMGGFHNIFTPMFKEDDDFIRRMSLLGIKMFTSLDALCYHFVSKTSRFSEEYKERTQQIENNSIRNYHRKWNSLTSVNKFNIVFDVTDCDIHALSILELFCDRIYVNNFSDSEATTYIENEQPHTTFNMKDRVRGKEEEPKGDIIISFSALDVNNNNLDVIKNFQDIISRIEEPGQYKIDVFNVQVNSLQNHIEELIFI